MPLFPILSRRIQNSGSIAIDFWVLAFYNDGYLGKVPDSQICRRYGRE